MRFGYMDLPEGDRLKVHYSAIPHSGGFNFFGILSLFVIVVFSTNIASRSDTLGLLLGGGLVFGLGVWDDLKTLPPNIRLIGQILAGAILFSVESRIETAALAGMGVWVYFS